MHKTIVFILSACFLLNGCQADTDSSAKSHYDHINREIKILKAQAQTTAAGSNIRIVVNMLTTNSSDYAALDSLFQYTDQNIIAAKKPVVLHRSGLKFGLADAGFKARLDIVKSNLKYSEETELFLVLADGATGHIDVGTEIAVPTFSYLGRWYSAAEYRFRRAGKSLKVTAHRLPNDMIAMKLTPVFSRFTNDAADMELTELTTAVTAPPGRTIIIGGTTGRDKSIATALFSGRSKGEKTQTLITVTPFIR